MELDHDLNLSVPEILEIPPKTSKTDHSRETLELPSETSKQSSSTQSYDFTDQESKSGKMLVS